MITVLLVFCAMFEFMRLMSAEKFVGWQLRLKEAEIAKEKPKESDALMGALLMPVILVYMFVTIWVAIFGDNLIAQWVAIGTMALSMLQTLTAKLISLRAVRFRVAYTIVDSFVGVVACCVMAYFYQKPM